MIPLKIKRKFRVELPAFNFDRQTLKEIAVVAEGSVIDNILRQQQADGGGLKVNAPSTRAMKRRAGRAQLSLIDKLKRFIQRNQGSWKHKIDVTGNRVTISPATAELKKLNSFVQKLGYTGWFGISKEGAEAIKAVLRKFIKREFRKAER